MAPSIVAYGLGMRGTWSWVTGQRPDTPRKGMLRLYPNGRVALTAALSMLKREKPKTQRPTWYTKNFPSQAGALTAVYTDEAMSAAYSAGVNAAGTLLYVKVAAAVANEFRVGHVAELTDSDTPTANTGGEVIAVSVNGASSRITLRLIEATTTTTCNPAAADRIRVIGNANEEASVIPDAVNYNPISMGNYTQIFRTPYEVSGSQLEVELITGDALTEEKREKFELHGVELEKAFWWGRKYETTANGKPKLFMQGIFSMIKEHASGNIFDYANSTDAAYDHKAWSVAGKDWLNEVFESIFMYGSRTKFSYCGAGVLTGLNVLAELYGNVNLQVRAGAYGIQVMEWITPHGVLLLRDHPLYSTEPGYSHTMCLLEHENLKELPLRDTRAKKSTEDSEGGFTAVDGRKEEWLTETTLEYHHPDTFAVLHNVGVDNA